MATETWVMKTLDKYPYIGTKIFGCNVADDKRVFIMSNCYSPLYIKLWCDDNNEKSDVINTPYGIGGFFVPADFRHTCIQIGVSADNENWDWTVHSYHNGGTS